MVIFASVFRRPTGGHICRKWAIQACRNQCLDCTGVSGSHMERFLKKSLTGLIFIDLGVILEGVLGAMLLIISVSTRCSVGVMETGWKLPKPSPEPSQVRGPSLSK